MDCKKNETHVCIRILLQHGHYTENCSSRNYSYSTGTHKKIRMHNSSLYKPINLRRGGVTPYPNFHFYLFTVWFKNSNTLECLVTNKEKSRGFSSGFLGLHCLVFSAKIGEALKMERGIRLMFSFNMRALHFNRRWHLFDYTYRPKQMEKPAVY